MIGVRARRVVGCLLAAAALSGCAASGGSEALPKEPAATKQKPITPVLVVNGAQVDSDGVRRATAPVPASTAKRATPAKARASLANRTVMYVAPPLLADGTIDDGPDPYAGDHIDVRPVPIEDDPTTTASVEAAAMQLRRIDKKVWDRWMAGGISSPWQQGRDATVDSIVRVTVEACGGARTVATGVVLGSETVVTTVHAIENSARRVRISAADGTGSRLPAMIRYLDIDDDVAVLKVPGLRQPALGFYAGSGAPKMGYAYGVAIGGVAGSLRRAPAMMSMDEASITREQPDGYGERISDRNVIPFVAGVETGFSGAALVTTDDPALKTGFAFHGLVRARVPFRAETAGVAVPTSVVRAALSANSALPTWFEQLPGLGCPQWRR
ncbi:MAG: MarP family serine protease [Thermoleophilia bacterium]|nr:MarP family serine protease [Thermoleophilia bacterium]